MFHQPETPPKAISTQSETLPTSRCGQVYRSRMSQLTVPHPNHGLQAAVGSPEVPLLEERHAGFGCGLVVEVLVSVAARIRAYPARAFFWNL